MMDDLMDAPVDTSTNRRVHVVEEGILRIWAHGDSLRRRPACLLMMRLHFFNCFSFFSQGFSASVYASLALRTYAGARAALLNLYIDSGRAAQVY